MVVNDTVYENFYNYMKNLLYARSLTGYADPYYSGAAGAARKTGEIGTSFADIYANAQRKLDVPESMDAIFEEAASLYDVPVQLLKAIGKAESNFDAAAVSCAGAIGVMQLMPSTAAALGVEDPYDARSNIMGGARYISEKLAQYGGDIDLALAAYNAGSGNVEKYGGVPPFEETKNYIQKIKEYMGMDLETGKTVSTGESAYNAVRNSSTAGEGNNLFSDFSEDAALYYVELLRLQMGSRAASLSASLGSADGEDGLW